MFTLDLESFQSCISHDINIGCTAGQLAFWRKGLLRLFHTLQLFFGIWIWSSMNEWKYRDINYLDLGHMPYFLFELACFV